MQMIIFTSYHAIKYRLYVEAFSIFQTYKTIGMWQRTNYRLLCPYHNCTIHGFPTYQLDGCAFGYMFYSGNYNRKQGRKVERIHKDFSNLDFEFPNKVEMLQSRWLVSPFSNKLIVLSSSNIICSCIIQVSFSFRL